MILVQEPHLTGQKRAHEIKKTYLYVIPLMTLFPAFYIRAQHFYFALVPTSDVANPEHFQVAE